MAKKQIKKHLNIIHFADLNSINAFKIQYFPGNRAMLEVQECKLSGM